MDNGNNLGANHCTDILLEPEINKNDTNCKVSIFNTHSE